MDLHITMILPKRENPFQTRRRGGIVPVTPQVRFLKSIPEQRVAILSPVQRYVASRLQLYVRGQMFRLVPKDSKAWRFERVER